MKSAPGSCGAGCARRNGRFASGSALAVRRAALGCALAVACWATGCAETLQDTVPRAVSLTIAPALPYPVVGGDGLPGQVVAATVCLERFEVEGSAHVIADARGAWTERLARALVGVAHAHPGHEHGAEATVAGGFHGRILWDLAEPREVGFETAPVRARSVGLGLCGAPEAAVTLTVVRDPADASSSGAAAATAEVSLVLPGPVEVEEVPFEVDWTGEGPFALELRVDLARLAAPGGVEALGDAATWGVRTR